MKRLTKEREARGWTRTELGFHSRIHPARVGHFENGRATPPDSSVELKRLAEALGWRGEPAALLDEIDDDRVVAR